MNRRLDAHGVLINNHGVLREVFRGIALVQHQIVVARNPRHTRSLGQTHGNVAVGLVGIKRKQTGCGLSFEEAFQVFGGEEGRGDPISIAVNPGVVQWQRIGAQIVVGKLQGIGFA